MASRDRRGPYRVASEPSPDEEVVALAELVARAHRVHRMVAVPVLSCGVLLAMVEYFALRRGLFAGIDVRAPYLAALVVVLPLVVAAQTLAAYLGRRAVVARSPAWIAEITRAGESRALLEAYVRSL
jgi:hypothetical protein